MPKRIVILLTLVTMLGGAGGTSRAQVFVELVPDPPGPYATGQHVTVHVWLHSSASEDVRLRSVTLDFVDSAPELVFDAEFIFDYSSIESGIVAYLSVPELPSVCTANGEECYCPEDLFLLMAGGSLHIGSVGVSLPSIRGAYRMDALNVNEPDPGCDELHGVARGSALVLDYTPLGPRWTAFNGELTGGTLGLAVDPSIPTVSSWGTVALVLLVLAVGTVVLRVRGEGETVRT